MESEWNIAEALKVGGALLAFGGAYFAHGEAKIAIFAGLASIALGYFWAKVRS